MNIAMDLAAARLGAARQADADDAALWRWLADLMEERRLAWRQQGDGWAIDVDGATLVWRPGFDDAMRAARALLARQPAGARR